MRNIHLWILAVIISTIPEIALAQRIKGLDLGVSAYSGRNYYNRKYYGQTQLAPGTITKLNSNYSVGAGIWAEQYFTPHLSSLFNLDYMLVDAPVNMICACNYVGSVVLLDEKHHWASLATGVRYYINPKSAIRFFVDGKIKADWFMAMTEKRIYDVYIKSVHWNALGYQRLVPSFSLAIGVKWKRFSLNAEYASNIARTFTRDAGVYNQIVYPYKTGIFSQGLYAKASFAIFKVR